VRRELAERWPEPLERFRTEFECIAGVFHRVPDLAAVPRRSAPSRRGYGRKSLVTWDPARFGSDAAPALARRAWTSSRPAAGQEDEAAAPPPSRAGRASPAGPFTAPTSCSRRAGAGRDPAFRVGRPRVDLPAAPTVHVAVFGRDRLLRPLEQVGVMLEALHVSPDREMSGAMINFITGPIRRTADPSRELTLYPGRATEARSARVFVEAP